jgi:hypothetical protein
MNTDFSHQQPATPDARDVVTEPGGSANLHDPASSGPIVPAQPAEGSGSAMNPASRQLDAILHRLTTYGTPVLREIAARAADVVAKASEAAGPVAQRAAGMTQAAGGRLAAKGREIASDLRSEGRLSAE